LIYLPNVINLFDKVDGCMTFTRAFWCWCSNYLSKIWNVFCGVFYLYKIWQWITLFVTNYR